MKKRTILFALTITLLLAGCGAGREEEAFLRWRDSLSGREISFTGEITALGEEETAAFTAAVTGRGDGVSMTVLAPETIRGVTVTSDDGGRALSYEDLVLSLTPRRPEDLSPCAGPALLLSALARGNLLWVGREETGPTAALTLTGRETVTLWRDDAGIPLYAEIAGGERTELTIHISDWSTKE